MTRITLATSRAPALPEPPGHGFYDLDARGATEPPGEDGPWPCLLLADVPDEPALRVVQDIAEEAFPEGVCEHGRAFTRRPQLRCEAGSFPRRFYADGAAEAEAVLDRFAKAGATIRYGG